MRNVSWSLIIFCIWPQPSATFKCDAVLILIFMDCGGARAVCEGYGQNKLPLIPMEGKVQINSYSHFNAFMLMRVQRERTVNPHEEEGEGGRRVDVKFCTWEISRHEGKLAWKMELMRYRPICRRHANTHTDTHTRACVPFSKEYKACGCASALMLLVSHRFLNHLHQSCIGGNTTLCLLYITP